MSWIWSRSWALSDSNSTTGGSWATSLRTWPGCAVTRASPTTAPPLLPKTYAGSPPRADSRRGTSAACCSGVTSWPGVLAAAVADAPRVVGHDGVVAGHRGGEPGKTGAVHRRADQQQQRAGAPPLVVQPCTGHGQGMSQRV